MSKIMNERMSINPSRRYYNEQIPYSQKKKKVFPRINSLDDTDIIHWDAPENLKQIMNTSIGSNGQSSRNVTRTSSASEMPSFNNRKKNVTIENLRSKLKFVFLMFS